MSDPKPRRVKAKITRTVTEIAIVLLDRNGEVEEYEEQHEELDGEVEEVIEIRAVLSVHY
jgi:hypothetical protein